MAEVIVETEIQRRLSALRDTGYRDFHAKLIPNVAPERIVGVRVPALRKLAKELAGSSEAEAFLRVLPHRWYEEDNLHGLLLCASRDYEGTVAELARFLPYVDNWATCDLLSPKAFQKRPPELPPLLLDWARSEQVYTCRFALGRLMALYLDDPFLPEGLELAAELRSEEYYVNMMRAWYFATALAKQFDAAFPYLVERRMDRWTHNKTIQKAVESDRIPPLRKDELRLLRWKE